MLTNKEVESHFAEVLPTRMLRQACKSISPVGPGTAVKITLGLMLGLILGVFGAFVVEFLTKVGRLAKKFVQPGK